MPHVRNTSTDCKLHVKLENCYGIAGRLISRTGAVFLICHTGVVFAGTSLSVPSDILTTYRPALLAEESVWVPLPPAWKSHVDWSDPLRS